MATGTEIILWHFQSAHAKLWQVLWERHPIYYRSLNTAVVGDDGVKVPISPEDGSQVLLREGKRANQSAQCPCLQTPVEGSDATLMSVMIVWFHGNFAGREMRIVWDEFPRNEGLTWGNCESSIIIRRRFGEGSAY